MESIRNNEVDGLQLYRRQLERMSIEQLENEFVAQQDKHHVLAHRDVFADSAIDITSEQAFVDDVDSFATIEDVEQKLDFIKKELDARQLKKAA